MVSIDRWSLNRGVLVSLRWSMEQSAVVFVDRWSLNRGVLVSLRWSMDQLQCGLYRQVVLKQRCVSITEVAHGAATVWSL